MSILPEEFLALLDSFALVFTQPTYGRFLLLLAAAILTPGRRTIANLLRTAAALALGHASSYRPVFSQARWSMIHLACVLARQLVRLLPDEASIVPVVIEVVSTVPEDADPELLRRTIEHIRRGAEAVQRPRDQAAQLKLHRLFILDVDFIPAASSGRRSKV